MKNLAGHPYADQHCSEELNLAGVPIVRLDDIPGYEVRSRIQGQLGEFHFRRCWYYWSVCGPMPLDVARRIHQQAGDTVRTAGYAGGIDPDVWAEWPCPDRPKETHVDSYHVDSQEGLDLLARFI
ncbi:MAG: hypothetical protein ACPGVG_14395, partial [Mycobacterium sp.]